jgi:hypothetical protein
MTAKEVTNKLSHNKLTSVFGALSTLSALLLALVPGDVLTVCGEAIAKTQNPAVIGAMFAAGTILSSIGPSLVGRSAK